MLFRSSFEEANGTTTLADASGACNSGKPHEQPISGQPVGVGWTSAPGRHGSGISLDSAKKQWVELGDTASLHLRSFTVAAWLKRAPGRGSMSIIQKSTTAQGGLDLSLITPPPGFSWTPTVTLGTASIAASGVSTSGWHHIAATYDGEQLKLYWDGILRGTVGSDALDHQAVQGWLANGLPLTLGAGPDGTRFFEGTLDDVFVHRRAFSCQEIVTLAGVGSCP